MNTKLEEKPRQVGIIGAGYVSPYHIRALRTLKNVRIVALTDADLEKGKQRASEFQIPFARTTEEIYAARPDIVHILTPPSSHCELTLEALDHGCHVFVEKPMAVNEEQCDRMIQRANAVGRVLSVDHSAKFDPAIQKAVQLIKSGAIGSVVAADYVRTSEYPPYRGGPMLPCYAQGGYPFRDLGVHAFYLMELFLGEIEELETRHRTTGHHPQLAFDDWQVLVRCRRGGAHIHLCWSSRPIEHRLTVRGTEGVLELDLYLETCVLQRTSPLPKPVEAIVNATSSSLRYIFQIVKNTIRVATGTLLRSPDIHNAVCEFHAALMSQSAPPISAIEGKRMVAMLEKAASEADRQKREREERALKPATVLVTGGTGFLGSALVRALASSGIGIRVLARRAVRGELAANPLVTFVAGDLGDPEAVNRAMAGVQLVYHVGAATSGSWDDYECGTIAGTRNVVQSCMQHKVERLVYVSSLSVLRYAGLRARTRLDETADLEPLPDQRGYYAKSKLEAENIVLDAIRDQGLKAVIVRPGNIFGPGAERVPPYGIIALGKRWVVMGNGKTLLPLIYIDDLVDFLMKVAASEVSDKILHLVDPDQITQSEYLKYVGNALPGVQMYYVPMMFLHGVAMVVELLASAAKRSVPLTTYRLRSILPHLEFDCTAAQRLLGGIPRVGVHEGVRRTFGRHTTERFTEARVAYPEATARP